VFASGTYAQKVPDYSGNDLLRECTDKNSVSEVHCLGFISGVWAGASLMAIAYHVDKPFFLIPDGATADQLKDVAVRFLNEHPEKRHMLAGVLILEAWKEAFPPKP